MRAQQRHDVLSRLAAMDDDRQAARARKFQLGRKYLALHVARRKVVVVVETHLTRGNHSRIVKHWAKPGQISGIFS